MKTTPYDTGKVKIGCNYTPPQRVYEPSRTEIMLQRALLKDKSPVDTSGIWIVVITGLLMALPYIILAVRS